MKKAIPEFVRFCIIGGSLFVFDAVMLEILVRNGVGPFFARLISLALSLQLAYVAHGLFTFRGHGGFNPKNWLGFIGANLLGACINFGVFMAVLTLMGEERGMVSRISGLVAGTGVALFFNYWMNRRYVFKRKDL
jgi:putative flippase GtrA